MSRSQTMFPRDSHRTFCQREQARSVETIEGLLVSANASRFDCVLTGS